MLDDIYREIGTRVVLQAIKDYQWGMTHCGSHQKAVTKRKARYLMADSEAFFLSDHFSLFTDIPGTLILKLLKERKLKIISEKDMMKL